MAPDQKHGNHQKDTPDKGENATKTGGVHPVVIVLIGMVLALAVFIALYATDFTLTHLGWSVPALALSAFLVFYGSRKLRRK